jgi:hypothetical protein
LRNVANFVLFQAGWFAAVAGAAQGRIWIGPAVMALVIAVHIAFVPDRVRELGYLLFIGLLGTLADTALATLGVIGYPSSNAAWPSTIPPPWISALWIGFATLPRYPLAWLANRTWLAIAFGAAGGPLSYLAGVRMGAVAVGAEPRLTWCALAVEYAIATPMLLRLAPRHSEIGG